MAVGAAGQMAKRSIMGPSDNGTYLVFCSPFRCYSVC
jgi:hypothetical protein